MSIEIAGRLYPMEPSANGWFSLRLESVPEGARYLFVLADGTRVPDPASRFQPEGIHGSSVLCMPGGFAWQAPHWKGRGWEESVIYELHIGAFTREGTYAAAIDHLPRLADLGFTAIEIMPLAEFPGRWGWGYDGVFHYAPHHSYGTPNAFRRFIDAAHQCGLSVFLDVVYNHFGPEGNFLPLYAASFFQEDDPTPWGPKIAFHEPAVRQYFIDNVLHWLEDYRLDGLRFDAVDQIFDDSECHILEEMSNVVRSRFPERFVHLVIENPANGIDLLADVGNGRRLFVAEWNDDFHHAVHVATTGESTGHYSVFSDKPWAQIKKGLAEGYIHREKTTLATLPPTAFVHFLQNHDQVGNRALGDRLHTMLPNKVHRLLTEVVFLSPQIPLAFMGDDHLSGQRFRFFADYTGDLARDVYLNRYKEAENFGGYPPGSGPQDIADPADYATFAGSKLDWNEANDADRLAWQSFMRHLLSVRRQHIIPLLPEAAGNAGSIVSRDDQALFIDWRLKDRLLCLRANASDEVRRLEDEPGKLIYGDPAGAPSTHLEPWSTKMFVKERSLFGDSEVSR